MKKSLTLLAACLCAPLSLANSIKLELLSGFSSNPLHLNESLLPPSSALFEPSLTWQQDLFADFALNLQAYASYASALNPVVQNYKWQPRLEWQRQFGAHELAMHAEYSQYAKHYVSKTTGETGKYQGLDLAERYNYQQFDGQVEWQFALNKAWQWQPSAEFRQRFYTPFARLTNYNYQQWRGLSQLTWQNRQHRLRSEGIVGQRTYSNRPADEKTTDVSEAALQLMHYELNSDYRFRHKLVEVEFEFDYEWQTDAQRYYSYNKLQPSARLQINAAEMEWSAEVQFDQQHYPHRQLKDKFTLGELNQSWQWQLQAARDFAVGEHDFSIELEYRNKQKTADDAIYTYNEHHAAANLAWQLKY